MSPPPKKTRIGPSRWGIRIVSVIDGSILWARGEMPRKVAVKLALGYTEDGFRDLLPGEIGGHGLLPEAGEEELDLPLEVVELVIAPLDILQQLLVVRAQDGHGIPQHTLRHVAHAERFAGGLPESEGGLVEIAIVQVACLEGIVSALDLLGHEGGDGPRGERGEGQKYRADGHVEEGVSVGDLGLKEFLPGEFSTFAGGFDDRRGITGGDWFD